MNYLAEPYRSKAVEALAGAQGELAAGRYNNAANRAYYAAYHAAVAVLVSRGFSSRRNLWGHDEVRARFAGELVQRRKVYPADLTNVLYHLGERRNRADYGLRTVTTRDAEDAVRTAGLFVQRLLEQ